jgi:outer membrane protein assembly factor BamD (BamD/ComL family)
VAADAGELKPAIAAYNSFIKRFPDDNLVADAKARIAELKKQQAQQANSIDLSELQGQTG